MTEQLRERLLGGLALGTQQDLGQGRPLGRVGARVGDAGEDVTHVDALCDKVVVIAYGRSVFEGSVEELSTNSETQSLEDAFVNLIAANRPEGVEP